MIGGLRSALDGRRLGSLTGGDRDPDPPAANGPGDPVGVDVEDVSVAFGESPVLEDTSLSVAPGEMVGLVGPNGAGKTTLLRTISGVLSPDAGTVSVGGAPIESLSRRTTSRRVATVPQDTTVSFEFTVRQVVEMGRYPHRPRFGTDPDPGAVDRALERTDTASLADRPVDAVSGGERQRVILARALAQDAPVLVLDEPTASLDVNHQVRTLDLVRSLVDDGHTAVAAIHDLNLAARYCDRLALLAGGEVLARGDPAAVLTADRLGTAFDADAVVVDHPVTGTPLVTALGARPETRRTEPTVREEGVGDGRGTEAETRSPGPSTS